MAKFAAKSSIRYYKSCNATVFKVGDWVRVQDEVTPSGLTRLDIWLQPVQVLDVQDNNVKLRNKRTIKCVNIGRI